MMRAYYSALLAVVLADVGKRDEARRMGERLQPLITGLDTLDAGWLENSLSLLYIKTGDLERARTAARAAAGKLSSLAKPLPSLADAEERLGMVERLLGNPAAALEAFRSGLQVYIQGLGPDNALALPVRMELAYQQALNGEAEQALPELNRCLAHARVRSNTEDTFHALEELGASLCLAGRPSAGEPLLREALKLGAGFLSPSGPAMALAGLELGDCLQREGHRAEALPLYQKAYSNLSTYYGDVYITREAQARLKRVRQ